MSRENILFRKISWHSKEQSLFNDLSEEISSIDGEELKYIETDELCNYFEKKFKIDVPSLKEDKIGVYQKEVDSPYISHQKVTELGFTIPFEGDAMAFEIAPSSINSWPKHTSSEVRDQELILKFLFPDLSRELKESVKKKTDSTIDSIKGILDNLDKDVSDWNSRINNLARQQIESRKEKLKGDQNLAASLGFPLKVRSDSSMTYFTPNVRRKITPTFPKASTKLSEPYYILETQHYEHILSVIESMAIVMERNPYAFKDMSEEALRVLFLVALNGHYEGQATGETFNYGGKTDILIRWKDRNIFIGECKFWKGPKTIPETIDQILGYSSWRDTKVAILIFNRNKNFSKVIKAIPETVEKHNNYKKSLKQVSETQFRYVFTHRDDPDKEITLSILLFNVPNVKVKEYPTGDQE